MRIIYKKVVFCVLCLLGLLLPRPRVWAQFNLPMINQYYTNPYLLNPAQAGGYDYPVLYLTYKNQWTGVSGNPTTTSFTANTPFLQSSGIGINVYNDQSGLLSKTKAVLSFSQTVFLGADQHYLSFGLSAGVINQHINLGQVRGEVGKPIDPVALAYNGQQPFYPDVDAGLAYRYHGLNANLVLPNLVKFTRVSPSLSNTYIDLPLYFASIGYEIPLGELVTVHPMVAAHKVQGVSNQFDVSGLVTYGGSFSVGAFYHNNQSYTLSLGFLAAKTIDINYAYTQSSGLVQQYFGSTHEFSLGYHFSKGSDSRSSKNRMIRCPKPVQ